MCTASWSVGEGRLSLFFNRDERKTRSEASPPALLTLDETRLLAALDPDAGGTWLAVNEFGLCVFLLNNYGAEAKRAEEPRSPRSRGELPLRYAACRSREAAMEGLHGESFEAYRPFLLGVANGDGVELFSWNGEAFQPIECGRCFITTSSFQTDEVQAYRESQYDALAAGRSCLEPAAMLRLHTSTPHPDAAFNPMMLREDSRTHSLSHVEVEKGSVAFRYQAVIGETRGLGAEAKVCLPRGNGSRRCS